jgi:hypothetical protein
LPRQEAMWQSHTNGARTHETNAKRRMLAFLSVDLTYRIFRVSKNGRSTSESCRLVWYRYPTVPRTAMST